VVSIKPQLLYAPKKEAQYQLGWLCPRASLDVLEKRINSSFCPKSNSGPSYTQCYTPAPLRIRYLLKFSTS
jgi:hypothetical protein